MSEEPPPPPHAPAPSPTPANPTPSSGGLSRGAWFGIGCASLALIAVVAAVLAALWALNRVADTVKGFAEDPSQFVEFVINANPDLEVERNDPAEGVMVIRNTTTGEETKISYQDIRDGKISFDTEEGTFAIDASDSDGAVSVTTPDGETVVSTDLDVTGHPAWLPLYPGADPTFATRSVKGDGSQSGMLTFTTVDAPEKVIPWTVSQLENSGLSVSRSETRVGNGSATVISATTSPPERSVTVTVTRSDQTQIAVNYEDKPSQRPTPQTE